MNDPTDPRQLRQALSKHFGLESFRPRQEDAISAVISGRDVLLTMPTGSGKSLAYQLPAVVLDGMTLVVSPLIALMKDQVDALTKRGLRARCLHSNMSGAERLAALEAAAKGEVDLLFVTPERFRSPVFLRFLPRLSITRLAIDEAHCISHWGHDFRPDYSRLGKYRKLIGSPPTIALTATATPDVADDIVKHLELEEPLILRTGIERPNLFMRATTVLDKDERIDLLADRIARLPRPGIVYFALIRDLEATHSELLRRGVKTLCYHGKLSPEERRSMQDGFMGTSDQVVLATNAFGMGIDKADIRFVIHEQIPRTLEAWTQEVGRAGRDGLPSYCELFYLEEDISIQQGFVKWANPSREFIAQVAQTLERWGDRIALKDEKDLTRELLIKNSTDNRVGITLRWLEVLGFTEGSFEKHNLTLVKPFDASAFPEFAGSDEKHEHDLQGLLTMVRFATSTDLCRRAHLARHFALPEPDAPCGACDICTSADAWLDQHARTVAPPTPPSAEAPLEATAEASESSSEFSRGDWVRINRRHIGQVVKVEGEGRSLRLLVESAEDLKQRSIDPNRQRVERLR